VFFPPQGSVLNYFPHSSVFVALTATFTPYNAPFSDSQMIRAWRAGQERAWSKLWYLGVHPIGCTSDKPPAFWPGKSNGGGGSGGGTVEDGGRSSRCNAELPLWFARPWEDETALLRQMREADADERDMDVVDG
jgi:hypothetical protein